MHNSFSLRATMMMSVAGISLAACDLSPEFSLPELVQPATFKEADTAAQITEVAPAEDGKWKRLDDKAGITEFAWWRMYEDATLDGLMERAMMGNPTLEVAAARIASARSVVDTRAADVYPRLGAGFGPERSKPSAAAQEPNLPVGTPANTKPYTLYTARGTISYELDLFGQNRGRVRAAEADAKAEQQNYRAARLALQTELAQTYFRLAALEAENELMQQMLTTREKSLALMRKKFEVGAIDTLVLSSAEAEKASVEADAAAVKKSRDMAQHALAMLVGVSPGAFNIETTKIEKAPPAIPAGLPASLLERRPDVQQAAHGIAAANERIGVARGGYFPDISLSAAFGFVSGDLSSLFNWSNRTWMVGPLAGTIITQPIFEGGKIAAARAQTNADYAAAVASYKQSVLTAFREVEDQLSAMRQDGEQLKAVEAGVDAATRANKVAQARFDAGYTSNIEWLDARRTLYTAKRAAVQVRGQQWVDHVQLIKALGGSWDAPAAVVQAPEAPVVSEKVEPTTNVEELKPLENSMPADQEPAKQPAEPSAEKMTPTPEVLLPVPNQQDAPKTVTPAEDAKNIDTPPASFTDDWWDDALGAAGLK